MAHVCERSGVATVLNNLLENREMALESGAFLCAAKRFDALSEAEREEHRLIRVAEAFRVVVVGVPVPRYPGNPLVRQLCVLLRIRLTQPAGSPAAIAFPVSQHPFHR